MRNFEGASNLPPEFSRSSHWRLDELSISHGLELTISFDPDAFSDEEQYLEKSSSDAVEATYCIRFGRVAEWTFVDLVYMWQYFPIHDSPPVLAEIEQADPGVYVGEFSLNHEVYPEKWRRFRVTVGDDLIEVLTADDPVVERL